MNKYKAIPEIAQNEIIEDFLRSPGDISEALIRHIRTLINDSQATGKTTENSELLNHRPGLTRKYYRELIGEMIADNGTEQHQMDYLLKGRGDIEIDFDYVNALPNTIKRKIIRRGFLSPARLLLECDRFTFANWAEDLGFSDSKQSEGSSVQDMKREFQRWADENLIENMKKIRLDLENSKEIIYKNTYYCWIDEFIGQMGYDLYHNSWGNGYGFLADEIKEILFSDKVGLKSEILKLSVEIDSQILNPSLPEFFEHTQCIPGGEEEALARLTYVSEFWCIQYSQMQVN